MTISNRMYDIIKFVSLLIAPIVTFVSALATIWGWGDVGTKVVATISAIDVLLGAVVVVLKTLYDKQQKSLKEGEK